MADAAPRYQVGSIGEGATVLQGEYLQNITLQVANVSDAVALLHRLRGSGQLEHRGPLLRRLDPIVFVNRVDALTAIKRFFGDSTASVLYILGLPAIGKSTVVRGALELRRADTPVVWVPCEGLDAEQLLAEINAGLHLNVEELLADSRAPLSKKIGAVLGTITHPSILVLDGFEAQLDVNGCISSAPVAEVLDSLVTSEHTAKVLVTTRRLPDTVGQGTAGIQILNLRGLSEEMSQILFETRAHLTPEQCKTLLPQEVLQKLGGHPKFIELLASAIADLPAGNVAAALLQTSDIGKFLITHVISQIDAAELQVLRAAIVFRTVFTFDALSAVHAAVAGEAQTITQPVRMLVRRAVLETVTEPQIAYYLHPILSEAVPREKSQEAAAHAAAATWFQQKPFDGSDVTTWDDTLYHLRKAAELGQSGTYFQPYREYVLNHDSALEFAGWGRRVISELKLLVSLAPTDDILVWDLGQQLWTLGENEEALSIFAALDSSLDERRKQMPDYSAQNFFWLVVKAKLGSVLVELANIDEASRLADEMGPAAEASGNVQICVRYCQLRFAIAHKKGELQEMLRWADETMRLAGEWARQSPSVQTKDCLAEAHFNMAVTHLRREGDAHAAAVQHFVEQLRIKLDIGKLSGVQSGLFNLGALSSRNEPVPGAALLLCSQEIANEIGKARTGWQDTQTQELAPLLSDPQNIETGRKTLAMISEKLIPYYERALARRAGESKT